MVLMLPMVQNQFPINGKAYQVIIFVIQYIYFVNDFLFKYLESIDGAFSQNGKTFFFKNGKYWRFTNYEMDPNYPEKLHRMYSEIPKNIDDATVWMDGKVYFFAGSKVYRMDEFNEKNTTVTEQKLSKHWKGIPNRVDAVHYSSSWGLTFFFIVDNFYAYEPVSRFYFKKIAIFEHYF